MLTRLCAALIAFCPLPGLAETRALLVGVADYTHLDADLRGPAADVALMAEVLALRGVGKITALVSGQAEGLAPGILQGPATRANILQAMAVLAEFSEPGDTAVFYFSGHGAQAPDQSGDEGGGFDEILLPADATGWNSGLGAVENALLDDELQDWAAGLLARGVKVIGVIDACHSATGFRAMGGAGTPRGLSPEALGIPPDAPQAAPGANPAPALQGPFVFLYSSQADQRSFEYPLADGSAWHGAFTLRLAGVLRDAGRASWAQVLRATTDAMVQGAARQDPDAEGPLLSQEVFGTAPGLARIAVKEALLQAGLLQGLESGAEVALFADLTGAKPLGTARLAEVAARSARLDPAPPPNARWAEVIAPAPLKPLVLAAAIRADASDGQDYAGWLAALPPPDAARAPDLVPVLTGGDLALVGAEGVLDPAGPGSSPRVRPEPGETAADAVARVLQNASHAHHLRKLLAAMSGRGLTATPALQLGYTRRAGKITPEGCTPKGPQIPVYPAEGLSPCDQLWLTFTNVSGSDLEVSVLYFNADFTISGIWPRGLSNRLAPGETARAGLLIAPGLPPALEEVMVLAVPQTKGAERVDLTRLASPEMTRGYAGADSQTELWFAERIAPDLQKARGFSTKPPAVLMMRQTVRVRGMAPE